MFYRCPKCGKIIFLLDDNANNVKCCNNNLIKLENNSVTKSFNNHLPCNSISNDKIVVTVGEEHHKTNDKHYIMFIAQVYNDVVNIKKLSYKDVPKAEFDYIKGSKIYVYCNVHGLWVKEIK